MTCRHCIPSGSASFFFFGTGRTTGAHFRPTCSCSFFFFFFSLISLLAPDGLGLRGFPALASRFYFAAIGHRTPRMLRSSTPYSAETSSFILYILHSLTERFFDPVLWTLLYSKSLLCILRRDLHDSGVITPAHCVHRSRAYLSVRVSSHIADQ